MSDRRTGIGSAIAIARDGGWDATEWIRKAQAAAPLALAAANDVGLDLSRFDVARQWSNIPPREWLMPPLLVAGHYSMVVATGASGKSALAVTTAVALVTGRGDMLGYSINRPCKVVLINGEDGPVELMRRVWATCLLFGVSQSDLSGRLMVIGARQVPGLTFNRAAAGGVFADDGGLSTLEHITRAFGADVIIMDPLSSFLPGGTNDGASASAVSGRLTEICVQTNSAMLLVHHTSKAAAREGDNDPTAALGSAMWANHARSIWNARRPSVAEAQAVGQPPSSVGDLLVLLHSKANLTRAEGASFIELKSVQLPNATPKYPKGDTVGVARRLKPGLPMDIYTAGTVKAVLDRIAQGATGGSPYKATGRAGAQDYKADIAAILKADFPNDSPQAREKLASQLINQLLNDGRLIKATVTMPRTGSGKGGGKSAEGLLVNWSATDWSQTPGPGPHVVCTGAPQGTTA